jgi:hypothetical protein
MELVIYVSVPVANRPGVFAVVTQRTAKTLREGYMKLFERKGDIVVETITRARRSLFSLDDSFRLVFFAIDQNGNLVTEIGS